MDENLPLNTLPDPDVPSPLPAYSLPRRPFSYWAKNFWLAIRFTW